MNVLKGPIGTVELNKIYLGYGKLFVYLDKVSQFAITGSFKYVSDLCYLK